MHYFPQTTAQLRRKISSYRSSFNKEQRDYGRIRDGSGKRYLLFYLYFVLNDLEKSQAYLKWYEAEFADDAGEPIQKLCWALTLYRLKDLSGAKCRLCVANAEKYTNVW